jgi:hypothetical protein
MRLDRGAGDEEVLPRADKRTRDGSDLVRRLALTEDDLGKTLPDVAVMVDPGEAQILVRALAQELKELFVRRLRRSGPGADLVEQAA